MIQRFLSVISALAFGFGFSEAWSCQIEMKDKYLFFASFERGSYGSYGPSDSFRVFGCTEQDWVMLAFAPSFQDYGGALSDSYTGDILPRRCHVEGLPSFEESKEIKIGRYEDESEFYKRSHATLNSCLRVQIDDIDGRQLEFPESQPSCRVERVAPHSAILHGNYCFYSSRNDNVRGRIFVDPECSNKEFLKEKSIEPRDIPGRLRVELASDTNARSPARDVQKVSQLRFSLDPTDELVGLTNREDRSGGVNEPIWPAVHSVEAHMGSLEISNQGHNATLESNLFVRNKCLKRCVEGLCSSPCHYMAPKVGEYVLYEINEGKKEFVDSWYQGYIVFPQHRGMTRKVSRLLESHQFNEGERYQLDVIFRDPQEDYLVFSRQLKRIRLNLGIEDLGVVGREQLNAFPELPKVRPIPQAPQVPPVGENPQGLREVFRYYENFEWASWPPFYRRVCDSTLKSCFPPSKGRFTVLSTQFRIGNEEKPSAHPLRRARQSLLTRDYKEDFEEFPKVKCRRRGLRPITP